MVKLSDCWRTPKWLADALGRFDLDPCSGPGSHIRAAFCYLPEWQDGLVAAWDVPGKTPGKTSVFVNPPYSDPGPWAARLAAHDGPWVALVKLDPTTAWWRALIQSERDGGRRTYGTRVAAFKRRIRFEPPVGYEGPVMTANFPSALVWRNWWPDTTVLQNALWMVDEEGDWT